MNLQQTIISGIKEQLFYNDYLVLPGFGGFVLKSRGAHFPSAGGRLSPPAKTISFNAQLKQNDGILVTWLQNKMACSAPEALKHLTEFAQFCGSVLNTKRRLSIDGIGFFYLEFENNICFEPQQDANFLTDSFGLAPISAIPIELELEEIPKKVFVDRVVPAPEERPATAKAQGNYGRLVVPGLITLLFVSLVGIFISRNDVSGEFHATLFGEESKTSYIPFSYPELELVKPAPVNKTFVADANGVATLALDENKHIAVKVFEMEEHKKVSHHAAHRVSRGGFEVVLGCFAVHENANRMVHKLSGQNIEAQVSAKNEKGMYVVSNGNFDSKEEALQKLDEIKSLFPKAWIKASRQ